MDNPALKKTRMKSIQFVVFILFICILSSCKTKEEREAELMHWEVVSDMVQNNIKVDFEYFVSDPGFDDFSFSVINIEAYSGEGEIILSCVNHTFKPFKYNKSEFDNLNTEISFIDERTFKINFKPLDSDRNKLTCVADIYATPNNGLTIGEHTKLYISREYKVGK